MTPMIVCGTPFSRMSVQDTKVGGEAASQS
jgi:hypothetical protein